jgi:hypothetical protein
MHFGDERRFDSDRLLESTEFAEGSAVPTFERSTKPEDPRLGAGHKHFPPPALSPREKFLDVGELQFDVGRPSMIALAGARRPLHLA